jgi:hypothetical protein
MESRAAARFDSSLNVRMMTESDGITGLEDSTVHLLCIR